MLDWFSTGLQLDVVLTAGSSRIPANISEFTNFVVVFQDWKLVIAPVNCHAVLSLLLHVWLLDGCLLWWCLAIECIDLLQRWL